jgi:hypothetical protein
MARTREQMLDTDERRNWNRTSVEQEKESGKALVRSYANDGPLTVAWDISPEAIERGLVMLIIDGKKAVVSVEKLQRFLRWV